ncbi:rhodanese-like domain-containing protein [Candidatus Saccharibacteria bacterium]|nr:rhodanese-like domain-containing protein [Candidatus Saccharibacteria bacterium]MCL1963056.1 rhodanese-like domain-containing protein [Candidatus Saccharibacteria bacterium]
MKRVLICAAILIAGLVGAYFLIPPNKTDETNQNSAKNDTSKTEYKKISASEAKALMDSGDPYVLLDVRSLDEFNEQHIDRSRIILIPDSVIAERAATELPDKNILTIVYCRSGVRSAKAARQLLDMGYTNVRDLGGIIDWPYETIGEIRD